MNTLYNLSPSKIYISHVYITDQWIQNGPKLIMVLSDKRFVDILSDLVKFDHV